MKKILKITLCVFALIGFVSCGSDNDSTVQVSDSSSTPGQQFPDSNPTPSQKVPAFNVVNSKITDGGGKQCIKMYDQWLHQSAPWLVNSGQKVVRKQATKICSVERDTHLHGWITISKNNCTTKKEGNVSVKPLANLNTLVNHGNNAVNCAYQYGVFYLIENIGDKKLLLTTVNANFPIEANPVQQIRYDGDERNSQEAFQVLQWNIAFDK